MYESRQRLDGPEHPETLDALESLSNAVLESGDIKQAEVLVEELLAIHARRADPAHWGRLNALLTLAEIRRFQQNDDASEQLLLEAKAAAEALGLEPDHPQMIVLMNNLALAYLYQGADDPAKYDQAEAIFREYLEIGRRVQGIDHPETMTTLNNLGGVYLMTERYDEAAALFQQVLDHRQAQLAPDHPDTLMARGNLANVYRLGGRYDEAEPMLLATFEGMERVLGADHPMTRDTAAALARLYRAWERSDDAARWARRARDGA